MASLLGQSDLFEVRSFRRSCSVLIARLWDDHHLQTQSDCGFDGTYDISLSVVTVIKMTFFARTSASSFPVIWQWSATHDKNIIVYQLIWCWCKFWQLWTDLFGFFYCFTYILVSIKYIHQQMHSLLNLTKFKKIYIKNSFDLLLPNTANSTHTIPVTCCHTTTY